MKNASEKIKNELSNIYDTIGNIALKLIKLETYNKKLLQSDIDKNNKIYLLSEKINALQKENTKLKRNLAENQSDCVYYCID